MESAARLIWMVYATTGSGTGRPAASGIGHPINKGLGGSGRKRAMGGGWLNRVRNRVINNVYELQDDVAALRAEQQELLTQVRDFLHPVPELSELCSLHALGLCHELPEVDVMYDCPKHAHVCSLYIGNAAQRIMEQIPWYAPKTQLVLYPFTGERHEAATAVSCHASASCRHRHRRYSRHCSTAATALAPLFSSQQ